MAAIANTAAATADPCGVAERRATTSTGTSRILSRVRTFGTFRGNTGSPYPGPAAPKHFEAGRAAERAEWRDRRCEQRPGEDSLHGPAVDEQAENDPAEAVDPAERLLQALVEPAYPHHEQRAEHGRLERRVEAHRAEVAHPVSVVLGVRRPAQPKNCWCSRNRLSAMMIVATSAASTVVPRLLTSAPITRLRLVSRIIGTSANGMPKERTTWEMTSVFVGSSPSASTTSAGAIVIARRRNSGMRRSMKPCITTCPA